LAFVITEPCQTSKDASCVEVCPVNCIQTDDAAAQYFIDPVTCISCAACVDVCPVKAIYSEDEVPAEWRSYIEINAAYFEAGRAAANG
jgi:NAD-dependent dihydropyrimidine dehydrogenase PreA subunit